MSWYPKEKTAWKPRENLTCSQWADKYRVLDPETSRNPGPWRTDFVPYLRGPMDAFSDRHVKRIVLCFGSQAGKTECLINMQGYAVCQDPGPMLMVYPDERTAKKHATRRLKKNILSTPAWADRFLGKESSGLEYQFAGMFLIFGWGGSPASLASTPCRYVMVDETDKLPTRSGVEDDPVSLAEQRTKTYDDIAKSVLASTPTNEFAPIWRGLQSSDVVYNYYVPCPHCGTYQRLVMKQIKWEDGVKPAVAKATAYYECVECQGRIHDRHKRSMLLEGEWRPVVWDNAENCFVDSAFKGKAEKVAYQLNSIYSPSVSFGTMAEKFLEAKNDPLTLMPFVNGYLAEPWVKAGAKTKADEVLALRGDYELGTVPDGMMHLTMGVDCQKGYFKFVVDAWADRLTSATIDYGRVETWAEIEEVLETIYKDRAGNEYMVGMACIDSGYNAHDTYDFCAAWRHICRPIKGSSNPLNVPFNRSAIDKGIYAGMLELLVVDTVQAKDFVYSRLSVPSGRKGSWQVPSDVSPEFADEICSEMKVQETDKRGKVLEFYKQRKDHLANHFLDCRVYSYVAALYSGALRWREPQKPEHNPDSGPETPDWLQSSW